ncbi:uncharacterized exonuclease C637.09 isoform X2 [Eurytemora carolleeae]|uniref:uncharacterized exonuclease C637.09 isoform X2 n=1 Tax=Eurytemora carolleeae TaxID=1294199 RepID=UPI000C79196A|nr:uncharacterized exonuclease C637.09 isoform X2 [Eurytemora carolleeae]|eukprot:XP_023330635.1 uncharacterized exonuclease C637.09-like isoform X2 [Eurytemora affinis]
MSSENKRRARIASKKRKLNALLAVTDLNDSDGKRRKVEDQPSKPNKPLRNFKSNKNFKSKTNSNSKPVLVTSINPNKLRVEGDEYLALKARLRERKKLLTQQPKFSLKSVGENALLSVEKERRIPLFMSDLQSLMLYCTVGGKTPYYPDRWCTLLKWNRLTNVVCLVLDGLGTNFLETRKDELPWITSKFNFLEVVSPSSYDATVAKDLALIPISQTQIRKLRDDFGTVQEAVMKNEVWNTVKAMFPITNRKSTPAPAPPPVFPVTEDTSTPVEGWTSLKLRLLMNVRQLVTEDFPIPLPGVEEHVKGYVFTRDEYHEVHDGSPMFSIDCEMCFTERGKNELTRICMVNENLEVVYHSYVKPESRIVDYLTRYSGITAEHLVNVNTRLKDVQADLKRLLPPDAILVGQSLNCDLKALEMMHPYVIDTSIIFNITGNRFRKTKLSVLSSIFLKKQIQVQSHVVVGHSPEEDAKAAMDLVKLKLKEGYQFGDVLLGGRIPSIHEEKIEPQNDCIRKDFVPGHDLHLKSRLVSTITKTAKKAEKTVSLTVSESKAKTYETLENFTSEVKVFQKGTDHKDVLEKGKTGAVEHDFSITHLDLSTTPPEKICKRAEKFCKTMYSHTSSNGLFILILPGSKEETGAAAVTIVRPPQLEN